MSTGGNNNHLEHMSIEIKPQTSEWEMGCLRLSFLSARGQTVRFTQRSWGGPPFLPSPPQSLLCDEVWLHTPPAGNLPPELENPEALLASVLCIAQAASCEPFPAIGVMPVGCSVGLVQVDYCSMVHGEQSAISKVGGGLRGIMYNVQLYGVGTPSYTITAE